MNKSVCSGETEGPNSTDLILQLPGKSKRGTELKPLRNLMKLMYKNIRRDASSSLTDAEDLKHDICEVSSVGIYDFLCSFFFFGQGFEK